MSEFECKVDCKMLVILGEPDSLSANARICRPVANSERDLSPKSRYCAFLMKGGHTTKFFTTFFLIIEWALANYPGGLMVTDAEFAIRFVNTAFAETTSMK